MHGLVAGNECMQTQACCGMLWAFQGWGPWSGVIECVGRVGEWVEACICFEVELLIVRVSGIKPVNAQIVALAMQHLAKVLSTAGREAGRRVLCHAVENSMQT